MILAWDALQLLAPDIFVDTMGYAFAIGFCRFVLGSVPTAAYVHYPTISTDMLESLDPRSATGQQGVNAGQGAGLRGFLKGIYWRMFAHVYSRVGASTDVVMTNSTWTQNHIQTLWGPHRREKQKLNPISVVYPPVAVSELIEEIEISPASEAQREPVILYIAQFRPEKNHQLIVRSFAEFVRSGRRPDAKLVLVGSVRDDDDSKRVYQLRLLVNELHIKDRVEFHLDASWPEILEWLRRASVGVNGMWNEHFGIGVVEYQAAGLVSVVHDSGGPKMDIVVDVGGLTGESSSAKRLSRERANQSRLPRNHAQGLRRGLLQGPVPSGSVGRATLCARVVEALHRGGVCEAVDGADGVACCAGAVRIHGMDVGRDSGTSKGSHTQRLGKQARKYGAVWRLLGVPSGEDVERSVGARGVSDTQLRTDTLPSPTGLNAYVGVLSRGHGGALADS